jgi:cytochrome c biogenesis protein CcdA
MSQHRDSLEVIIFDTDLKEDSEKLFQYDNYYDVKNNAPQEMFLPDTFITGFEDISRLGKEYIENYLKNREKWRPIIVEDSAEVAVRLQERIDKHLAFFSITAAGLADGVNPCAIATMIFLISFLTLKKRKKGEILLIGLIYAATVFVTYMGLGLGAFKIITSLEKYHIVSEIIRWASVTLAGFVSLFSFADAFKYARGKKASEMTLQLPNAVKKSIHNVISKNISSRSLVVGAVITGFLVTLLEAVCTGQVYLPTIIMMTRVEGFKGQGWLWLIYYNFLFVLPLLIVMIAAYFGLTWNNLANLTQKHLTLLKIILGVVMLGIAVYLATS